MDGTSLHRLQYSHLPLSIVPETPTADEVLELDCSKLPSTPAEPRSGVETTVIWMDVVFILDCRKSRTRQCKTSMSPAFVRKSDRDRAVSDVDRVAVGRLVGIRCGERSTVWRREAQIYFERMVESVPRLNAGGEWRSVMHHVQGAPERLSCAKRYHGPTGYLILSIKQTACRLVSDALEVSICRCLFCDTGVLLQSTLDD